VTKDDVVALAEHFQMTTNELEHRLEQIGQTLVETLSNHLQPPQEACGPMSGPVHHHSSVIKHRNPTTNCLAVSEVGPSQLSLLFMLKISMM
jgi:hypothetical protein